VISALVWIAAASAGERRAITVEPGFPLVGEVLATLDDGFRVQVEQGTLVVPFDRVLDLREPASGEVQQRWSVVVVGDRQVAEAVGAALSLRPGVEVVSVASDPLLAASAASCGSSAGCVAALRPEGAWWFVVHAEVGPTGVTLHGRAPFEGVDSVTPLPVDDAELAWGAVAHAIGLEAESSSPAAWTTTFAALRPGLMRLVPRSAPREEPAPPLTSSSPKPARSDLALAFVPFPGVPSLVRKDWVGFAGAVGVTAATTTAWAFASGAVTSTRGEHAAVGLLGSYVGSVGVSQLFAARRGPAIAVTALPRIGADPGFQLAVVGSL
jgi:hypothetical protein